MPSKRGRTGKSRINAGYDMTTSYSLFNNIHFTWPEEEVLKAHIRSFSHRQEEETGSRDDSEIEQTTLREQPGRMDAEEPRELLFAFVGRYDPDPRVKITSNLLILDVQREIDFDSIRPMVRRLSSQLVAIGIVNTHPGVIPREEFMRFSIETDVRLHKTLYYIVVAPKLNPPTTEVPHMTMSYAVYWNGPFATKIFMPLGDTTGA